jgi:hypothetical protein
MTRDHGDHGDPSPSRSPDHPITGSPDLDLDPLPLLREVHETRRLYLEVQQQLPEIKRQFLEAKRRYRLFQEIVLLRRELWIRRLEPLEELARVLRLLRQQQSVPIRQNDPEADAARSRLAQQRLTKEKALKENFLHLQKLRELIRLGENLLYRQQRALKRRRQAAAAQVLPDAEMRDNVFRLQKLKRLYALRQDLLRSQERALRQHHPAGATIHHDSPVDAPRKTPQEPQSKPAPLEEPQCGASIHSCELRTEKWGLPAAEVKSAEVTPALESVRGPPFHHGDHERLDGESVKKSNTGFGFGFAFALAKC